MQRSHYRQNALLCTYSICPFGKSPFGCLDGGRTRSVNLIWITSCWSYSFKADTTSWSRWQQLKASCCYEESLSPTNGESQMHCSCLTSFFILRKAFVAVLMWNCLPDSGKASTLVFWAKIVSSTASSFCVVLRLPAFAYTFRPKQIKTPHDSAILRQGARLRKKMLGWSFTRWLSKNPKQSSWIARWC